MRVLQEEWLKAPGEHTKRAFDAGEHLVVVNEAGVAQLVISRQPEAAEEACCKESAASECAEAVAWLRERAQSFRRASGETDLTDTELEGHIFLRSAYRANRDAADGLERGDHRKGKVPT